MSQKALGITQKLQVKTKAKEGSSLPYNCGFWRIRKKVAEIRSAFRGETIDKTHTQALMADGGLDRGLSLCFPVTQGLQSEVCVSIC